MENNRTLLQKAEIAVADITSGGLLQPAQVDKFIVLATNESVLIKECLVTGMDSPKEEHDKLRFTGRVLKPGLEGQALPSADWAKPEFTKYTLDAQLVKAEVRLTDEAGEDSIEHDRLKDTIIDLLAKAVGRDMEYVGIQGDTGSSDPLLAVLNGILAQANVNIANASSAKLTKPIFNSMLRIMPKEFSKLAGLKFYTEHVAKLDYQDSLADRATGLGDLMLQNAEVAKAFGYIVDEVPEFPVDISGNTKVLFASPAMIHWGVYKKIRVEVDRDISSGTTIIVARLRWDVKLVEPKAVVKCINVKSS